MPLLTDDQPKPPRVRSPWLYRGAYILAIGGVLSLILSGQLTEYFAAFRHPQATAPVQPESLMATALLWLLSVGPLLLLSYELGVQHTSASRLNSALWRGLVESWRVAWLQRSAVDMAEDFAEQPADDTAVAVLVGLGAAAIPPVLFLSVMPQLRTPFGFIWIGGTGILFGVFAYCQRRAAAYLKDPPGAWSMFRQWSLLNTDRFAPEGHPFVRVQIACMVLLPFWWLGGGAMVMARTF